ncbi:uncharacterized protein MELLADRAFT_68843 [Melampsora larici-populina 98AG31]|uniref:Uncharacterized protein n=1 Tax=Melampsora larici-populina (strain 98AG31 / pathotype 3-4-7) TaxID=747676 RepID=F4S8D6_MELLP|nr:uncharacterized protein MELLADRAFT_68843 [Melampsora larici-populina 98AG31]EGF99110.1 hypothetical protein MELLADRAFT_68843 [Melampsora larici-populina 98AG31]
MSSAQDPAISVTSTDTPVPDHKHPQVTSSLGDHPPPNHIHHVTHQHSTFPVESFVQPFSSFPDNPNNPNHVYTSFPAQSFVQPPFWYPAPGLSYAPPQGHHVFGQGHPAPLNHPQGTMPTAHWQAYHQPQPPSFGNGPMYHHPPNLTAYQHPFPFRYGPPVPPFVPIPNLADSNPASDTSVNNTTTRNTDLTPIPPIVSLESAQTPTQANPAAAITPTTFTNDIPISDTPVEDPNATELVLVQNDEEILANERDDDWPPIDCC